MPTQSQPTALPKHTPAFGRGRGNNQASKANLTKGRLARKWWIFTRDTFRGEWQPMFGPYFYKDATAKANRLNTAAGNPEYTAISTHPDAK